MSLLSPSSESEMKTEIPISVQIINEKLMRVLRQVAGTCTSGTDQERVDSIPIQIQPPAYPS